MIPIQLSILNPTIALIDIVKTETRSFNQLTIELLVFLTIFVGDKIFSSNPSNHSRKQVVWNSDLDSHTHYPVLPTHT